MGNSQNNEQLKELVNSLCEFRVSIMMKIGPPTHFLQSQAASVEPLKTPIYVMRQLLGHADFPDSKVQRQWLASLRHNRPITYQSASLKSKTVISLSMTSTYVAPSSTSIPNFKQFTNHNIHYNE